MRSEITGTSLALPVALVVLAAGCASAPPVAGHALGLAPRSVGAAGLETVAALTEAPARLPPPESTQEAQSYLSGALAALRADQPQHAALFLDAILGSDHLSDRGRANIYWLAADAHRSAGHDEAYVNALGGFLVAADLLPLDEDLRRREVEARAALLARKLKRDPQLGKSPEDAIRVEDAREAAGVAAELGCVEDAVATHGESERRLEERRLKCHGREDHVVLWFDVTPR
jgi:hypothetical protein